VITRRSVMACVGLSASAGVFARTRAVAPAAVPQGYSMVAHRLGVPALLLYGIALQESKMAFGANALPYPWTLCVQGRGFRYPSYSAAVSALQAWLARGVRNVDCGLMQVNWGWHAPKLQTVWQALNPYPNLMVGASILKAQFAQSGDWLVAAGRYHHPSDVARAARYAQSVLRLMQTVPGSDSLARAVR
jgi:hypothetical protein